MIRVLPEDDEYLTVLICEEIFEAVSPVGSMVRWRAVTMCFFSLGFL